MSVVWVGDVDDESCRPDEREDAVGGRAVVDPDEELRDALEGPDVVHLLDEVLAVDRAARGVVVLALVGVAGPGDLHAEDGVGVDVDPFTPTGPDRLRDILGAPPRHAVPGELDDDPVVAVVVPDVQVDREHRLPARLRYLWCARGLERGWCRRVDVLDGRGAGRRVGRRVGRRAGGAGAGVVRTFDDDRGWVGPVAHGGRVLAAARERGEGDDGGPRHTGDVPGEAVLRRRHRTLLVRVLPRC